MLSQVFRATYSVLIPICTTTWPHGMHWIHKVAVWYFAQQKILDKFSCVKQNKPSWNLIQFLINSGSEKTAALVCSICIYYNLQIMKIFFSSVNSMIYYCTWCSKKYNLSSCYQSSLRNIRIMVKWFLNVRAESTGKFWWEKFQQFVCTLFPRFVYEKYTIVSSLKTSQPPLYLLNLSCNIQNLNEVFQCRTPSVSENNNVIYNKLDACVMYLHCTLGI